MPMLDPNFGKKIQISNSNEYISLSEKYDSYLGISYQDILSNMDRIASSLGARVGVNSNRLKLYLDIFGLGKVDGGTALLNYINSKISSTMPKIYEADIVFYNLSKIFRNYKNDFNEEELNDIAKMFGDDIGSVEAEIIKIAYLVELSSQFLVSSGQLQREKAAQFKLNEIKSIFDYYQQTRMLSVTQTTNNISKMLFSVNLQIDDIKKKELDDMLVSYNANQITKAQFINNINEYRLVEKKSKVK